MSQNGMIFSDFCFLNICKYQTKTSSDIQQDHGVKELFAMQAVWARFSNVASPERGPPA